MNASIQKFGLSLAWTLGLLVSSLAPTTVSADSAACDQAHWLEAGELWSSVGSGAFEAELLAVRVPAAGWLAVQASTGFAAGDGSFWLQFLSPGCDQDTLQAAAPGTYLNRAVVRVEEPGNLYLRVGPVASGLGDERADLRFSTHLFRAQQSPLFQSKDGEPGDGTEVQDPEILPVIFRGSGRVDGLSNLIGQDGEPGDGTEVQDPEILPILHPGNTCIDAAYAARGFLNLIGQDGEPGDGTEVEDPEILPVVFPGTGRSDGLINLIGQDGEPGDGTEVQDPEILPILLPRPGCEMETYRLASTAELDRNSWSFDHKDGEPGDGTEVQDPEILPVVGTGTGSSARMLTCATGEPANDLIFCAADFGPGRVIEGRFDDAGFAVDQDYYSFRVEGLEEILLEVESSGDLYGTLLDSAGRTLEAWVHDRRTSELEVILVPGRYYLRLEGFEHGAYRIRLNRSEPGI